MLPTHVGLQAHPITGVVTNTSCEAHPSSVRPCGDTDLLTLSSLRLLSMFSSLYLDQGPVYHTKGINLCKRKGVRKGTSESIKMEAENILCGMTQCGLKSLAPLLTSCVPLVGYLTSMDFSQIEIEVPVSQNGACSN